MKMILCALKMISGGNYTLANNPGLDDIKFFLVYNILNKYFNIRATYSLIKSDNISNEHYFKRNLLS